MTKFSRSLLTLVSTASLLGAVAAISVGGLAQGEHSANSSSLSSDPLVSLDPSGTVATITPDGSLDLRNPFFQSLGTNGRACSTCHLPDEGWSITPARIRARFNATRGLDPLFRTNDGSSSPLADVSTVEARRRAYNMLLTKGVIRVHLPIPANAEYSLVAVDDPYGYASAQDLSLFRRPLPATNLSFLTTVMWDGRNTTPGQSLTENLMDQASGAILGHAEAAENPAPEVLQQIVAFEEGLNTAQWYDNDAGRLDARGGTGGPKAIAAQEFFYGINDPLGGNPTGADFNPEAFTLYSSWASTRGVGDDGRAAARRAVVRGEQVFNTKQFVVTGVGGLNDALGQKSLTVTCTTCHDAPNVGDHSVRLPLNIGLTDASRRTPDLPLYTLRNNVTGATVQTTDPGRSLITGKWTDIGKFKGPILRGLAARAPYFHNGSAATLDDAIDFYDTRFGIGFTRQEKSDLAAFLRSL